MSEEKINFEVFRRFGPSILKVKIPENVLNSLNNQIDEILVDRDKQKKLDYGNKLVGISKSDQDKLAKATGKALNTNLISQVITKK